MSLRSWLEPSLAFRSSLLGMGTGLALYAVPHGLELSVMAAMMMPGVYLGYAWIHTGDLECLQEGVTVAALSGFNLWCLAKVALAHQPYYAPLSVLTHGVVDALHMWGLYPTSQHVHKCDPLYPKFCASFDIGMAAALVGCIWCFPRRDSRP